MITKTIHIIALFITAAFAFPGSIYSLDYNVQLSGNVEDCMSTLIKETSQLITLPNHTATAAALQKRADRDTANLIKALQSEAYYGAQVTITLDFNQEPALVDIHITPGPVYLFASFVLVDAHQSSSPQAPRPSYPIDTIRNSDLDITIGAAALPKSIIEAEKFLLRHLEYEGYPLAKIAKREVLADESAATISVTLHVETGPLTRFGEVTITGQKRVKDLFFSHKIAWKKGEKYQPEHVLRTINRLEASGLFSSIQVRYDEELDAEGQLPMHITVTEAKHRSIGFGVNYDTDLGPGLSGEWENRNLNGSGDNLKLTTNIWMKKKEGTLRYVKPDFCQTGQDLIWTAEAINLKTRGFDESSLSLSGVIERQIADHMRFSYGGMFKRLRNWDSDNNGSFNLAKIPVQFMYHKTNSLLNPTRGNSVLIKSVPTWQMISPQFAYTINTASVSTYLPLCKDHRFVLAAKATFGSILGAGNHIIPPSERFYAGSDSLLRGYRYLSVSPLDADNKPIGGKSMLIGSLEARARLSEKFGVVTFWDVGNVYKEAYPQFNHGQLHSVGIGARYYTPVGPLRLDVAFPLNPRKHIDNPFQIYFSIGQAF